MNRDQLFVETVRDLKSRMAVGRTEYEVLMSAVLLRKLLLDAVPLIHSVNRARRVKLQFTIHDRAPDRPAGDASYVWALGLSPDDFDRAVPTRVVKLSEFISTPVFYLGGKIFTVGDIVREAAHVEGAVHAGAPTPELSERLRSWDEGLKLCGFQPLVGLMLGIGKVVIEACQPLVSAVEKNVS